MRTQRTVRFGPSVCYVVTLLALAACGGGGGGGSSAPPAPSTFTIGGSVSGLGGTVVLQQSGANNLSVSANGQFTFAGSVATGSAYAVTLLTQPTGQKCTVSSGSGTATANVTSVSVACVNLYTVGGTVTGLTAGGVVLQNNSGDDLSVTTNGAFTFATTVAGGDAYSVSVLTQPPGPDCVVSTGSGSATANVTNVSVVCTVDPATSFLPLAGPTFLPGGAELHVVTSKSIARPPILVANNFKSALGFSLPVSRTSSGYQSAGKPTALLYAGAGAGSNHLYALDLTGASPLASRQVTTLTLAANEMPQYCEAWQGFTDVDDPDSAFWLLGLPTDPSGTCQQPYQFVRVRLADSATSAPADVNVSAGTKHLLYRPDGTFAGMLNVDTSTFKLVLYHGDSFTTPTPLLDDCVNFMVLQPAPLSLGFTPLTANPTYAFLAVFMLDGSTKLYRVNYTGAISADLYDVKIELNGGAAFDDNYLYFIDRTGTSTTQQEIFRVRLDGTTPAQSLYTYPVPDGDSGLSIVGVSGSKLVIERALFIDPMGGQRSSNIQTLSTSGPGTPDIVATFDDWLYSVILFKDRLFLTVTHQLAGPTIRFSYETHIVAPDGTVVQPLLAGSSFIFVGADAVQRVRDVTTFGLRNGSIESLSVLPGGALSATLLKRTDGAPFTLSDTAGYANSFGPASPIGMGSAQDDLETHAFIFDRLKAIIAPIAAPGLEFVRIL